MIIFWPYRIQSSKLTRIDDLIANKYEVFSFLAVVELHVNSFSSIFHYHYLTSSQFSKLDIVILFDHFLCLLVKNETFVRMNHRSHGHLDYNFADVVLNLMLTICLVVSTFWYLPQTEAFHPRFVGSSGDYVHGIHQICPHYWAYYNRTLDCFRRLEIVDVVLFDEAQKHLCQNWTALLLLLKWI